MGDRAIEERLFALVDSVNAVVPRGLRAHRVRFAAAALRRDAGTDALGRTPQDAAPEVERLLREAVDLYTSWGALAYEARARGELGVWLARQGRTDEAGPFLDASRTRLREVGAETWLGDLELSLVTAGDVGLSGDGAGHRRARRRDDGLGDEGLAPDDAGEVGGSRLHVQHG